MSDFFREVESMDKQDMFLASSFFRQSLRSKGESSVLQKLTLSSCNYSKFIWRELFIALSFCKNLTHLMISRNSLYRAGNTLVYSINDWGTDPPLQVLQLDQCLIPEDIWSHLFQSLPTFRQITHLDFSYNFLGESGSLLADCIKCWGDQAPLQKLDLSYCSMAAKVCAKLFRSLTSCRNITDLDLSGNIVGVAGYQLVRAIKSWGNDAPLERFIVEHCFIPTTVWPDLLTSLSSCNKLLHLDLSYNTLTGCLSSFLRDPHSGLHSLEELLLDSCSLNKKDLQHLIKCVESEKLPSLQNLYLNENRLRRIEDVLGKLIQCCTQHYSNKNVKIWVQGNYLSQGFQNTWVPQCEDTNVSLDLKLPVSTEKYKVINH